MFLPTGRRRKRSKSPRKKLSLKLPSPSRRSTKRRSGRSITGGSLPPRRRGRPRSGWRRRRSPRGGGSRRSTTRTGRRRGDLSICLAHSSVTSKSWGGCLYQCSCEIENLHQVLSITISIVDTIRIFVNLRSPTPLRGEHEQLLIEGVEEDDEDSRLEAALRGELKAEVLKGEESQVRIQMPFISNIQ